MGTTYMRKQGAVVLMMLALAAARPVGEARRLFSLPNSLLLFGRSGLVA